MSRASAGQNSSASMRRSMSIGRPDAIVFLMPGKLRVVVVLLGLNVTLGLISALGGSGGAWLLVALYGALLWGILKGNEGVRGFLRVLVALGILWSACRLGFVTLIFAGTVPAVVYLSEGLGIALGAYIFWALGQKDVREWMFRKSFSLDEPPEDGPPKAVAREKE